MTTPKSLFTKFLMLCIVSILFVQCRRNKEGLTDNEEELITTIRLKFTETGNGTVRTFTFQDIDGPGGAAPQVFNDVVLPPNKSFSFEISLLNESTTPAEDITEEVREEADDHQLFYVPNGVNMNFTNLNKDAAGLNLGTSATVNTGAAGNGTLRVVLKHKPGTKSSADDINTGETDIDITFKATVQ